MRLTNTILCRVVAPLLLLFAATAAAAAPLRIAVLPPDGCPSQAALDAELSRLLPAPPPSAYSADIFVSDGGDSFAVTVCGAERVFVDPPRNCAERARIAAVTIALTVAPPTVTFADPASEAVLVGAPQPGGVAIARAAVTPQLGAVIARPAMTPAPTGTNRFLLTLDVGGSYRVVTGTQDYGVGDLNLQLGVERPRWTLGGRAAAAYGTGIGGGIGSASYYGLLVELTFGPALAIKLGERVRLGLSTGLGIGWATTNQNWQPSFFEPAANRGLLIVANADVSVDLYRGGPHTLYAVLSPGMIFWTERQDVGGNNLQGQNELTLRLGLGYRFNH
jgi:hypothetical protein